LVGEEAAVGGQKWQVAGEPGEYASAAQMLQALQRVAADIADARAPLPELWESYCEAAYRAALTRLERHIAAVRARCSWIDSYGPLSVHMLECLLATGCFDVDGRAVADGAQVAGVLRAVREATDMPEGVEVAALAVTSLRMYLHTRDLDTLLRVQEHLARLRALSDRAFNTSKPVGGATAAANGYVPTRRAGGLLWYRAAALEEVLEALRRLLSDAHAYFVNPIDDIPVAVAVFEDAHALLHLVATPPGPAATLPSTAAHDLAGCLLASVRARFGAIVDALALPDGTVNVHGCIDAVTNLAEEVEVEALYFAPGYAGAVPRAVGLAVLEFVVCCKQSVQDSVQSFRTLSSEAVMLWRALTALQEVRYRS